MKKIFRAFLVAVFFTGLLSITGCANTWDGIGKDIEGIGKDIQDD
ncbi:hypothetical protein MNBD_GAMMA12-2294 [hydrothermal vent metagenome]|uniref:Entericidin EcnAB n=1 Tax=hydrothermal vent metagenome TaxID=652676 RepID=A0A3B0ZIC1_9ZZZZ